MTDLDAARRAAAARALVPDLPRDVIALPYWSNGHTTILASLDLVEHGRRYAAETGPVPYDSMPLLDLLMFLPEGEPVPWSAFSERDRYYLRGGEQAGAIELVGPRGRPGRMVVRRAVRPLRVNLAIVTGGPIAALNGASSFAPFCARAVLLRKHPGEDYLFEASFYGIGVATRSPDGEPPTVLLAPRPWVPKRHTPAGWNFAETAYKHLLTHPDLIPLPDGAR